MHTPRQTDAIIIGAGHAGLAVSHCLAEHGIDHRVLERGEVANSWRNERWDSLTLLTPNWQSRLPGYRYEGDDPDGFMDMDEVIGFIATYADRIRAPLETGVEVTALERNGSGYRLQTTQGEWRSRSVVVASGACNIPAVPGISESVPKQVRQVHSHEYRNPGLLADGGVLVVGASATGLQLAEEIQRSGRPVSIAVGEHVRLPRRYRGRDIQWWMDAAGILDEGLEDIDDVNRARHLPSPQLIGTPEHAIFDLNMLSDMGVRLYGRLMGFRDNMALFSGSLRNVCALADLKMNRLLNTIDEWAEQSPDAAAFDPPERFDRTRVADSPDLQLDLERDNITTILWATGYRPDHTWLQVPVLDRKGMIRHRGGVAEAEGMYVIGMPFLRRRKSSFIHGAEDDARHIAAHLKQYLDRDSTA